MEQTLPSRPVMQIELLGFLCNLSSSLYNYHHSHKTWPHWRYHFFNLDKFFGWIGGNHRAKIDMFNTRVYTLGLPNVHVPLYVPGGLGSTTGGHMFWILWSFIPVLYVAYYLCMYLLAPRSPGVKIQRAMLLFSMFHFLFLTGKRDTVLFSRMFTTGSFSVTHLFDRTYCWQTWFLIGSVADTTIPTPSFFIGLNAGHGAWPFSCLFTKTARRDTGSKAAPDSSGWELCCTTPPWPGVVASSSGKSCAVTVSAFISS